MATKRSEMMHKIPRKPSLSPYKKRRSTTHRKLQEALERLGKGLPTHPALQKRPTVSP